MVLTCGSGVLIHHSGNLLANSDSTDGRIAQCHVYLYIMLLALKSSWCGSTRMQAVMAFAPASY